MEVGELSLVAGGVMTAALAASLIAGRLRVPALLAFLGLGMAIGSEGIGGVSFGDDAGDYRVARAVGVVSLALILFEGGLVAGWREVRPVLAPGLSLALAGTVLTAVLTGLAAAWLFGFGTLEGLLVGSIVASTDGAAVFALLRASTLRRRLARTLECESGFNDPVAVLLVLGLIDWIQKPDYGVLDLGRLLVAQLGLGAVMGLLVGFGALTLARRVPLSNAGLYPMASLMTAAIAYGAADVLGGSGFLAVYLAGLLLGGKLIPGKGTIVAFHQGLAGLAQLALFLTLGLLVFPSRLGGVAVEGAVLALVLVLVARPLATLAATSLMGFTAGERAVLGWAGLRGAVPVVLATFPVIAGVKDSVQFFDIVFFCVLISTLVQGVSLEPLARRLGVTSNEPALPRPLTELGTIRRLGAEVAEYAVAGDDAIVGARVRDLGLPRDAVVNVIVRGQEAIPPRGSTQLQAGDHLHLLVRHEAARELAGLIERWGHGPIGPSARPRPRLQGRLPLFSVRRLDPGLVEGDVSRPQRVAQHSVIDRLRLRRDAPGALVVLDDGRYAVTGPLVLIGSRQSVSAYARRRLRCADDSESAWLQTVVGALAVEESWRARRPPGSPASDASDASDASAPSSSDRDVGAPSPSDRDASGSRARDGAAPLPGARRVSDARQSRSEDRGGVA